MADLRSLLFDEGEGRRNAALNDAVSYASRLASVPSLDGYDPSYRDRAAIALMGDRPSEARMRFVDGLLGSRGAGTTGVSVSDVTPLSILFGVNEAQRDVNNDNPLGALLNAAAIIPVVGAAPRAGRAAMEPGKRQLNKLGMFSKALEAAQGLKQNKGTPEQMRAALLKSGVKPDELKWTGFDDWAKGKKSITKDEAVAFLNENRVQIGEKTLAVKPDAEAAGRAMAEAQGNRWDELSVAERGRYVRAADGRRITDYGADPKFQQYTLPGGDNYREVLLKTPGAPDGDEVSTRLFGVGLKEASPEQRAQALAEVERHPFYKSSHWDEPNVLAHLRMKDRIDPEGRRVLHLEELQSDWAQEGRKKGFAGPEVDIVPLVQRMEDARQRSAEAAQAIIYRETGGQYNSLREVLDTGDRDLFARIRQAKQNPELQALHQQAIEAEQALSAARRANSGRVPNAPFVDGTQKWTDLALKRALREAAEGNYDALAWTPGAAQAKRYDLSKQIDSLNYGMSSDGRTVSIEAVRGGENVLNRPNVPVGELEGLVGKEVAERIIKGAGETDPNTGYRVLSGLDLQVGGEGMRGYYDKIVPTQLRKLAKDLDPQAPFGTLNVTSPRGKPTQYRDFHEYQNTPAEQAFALPSLTITPAMREKIKQGLPLFTMAPAAFALPELLGLNSERPEDDTAMMRMMFGQ
jgi:hypothetical protein